MAYEIDGQRVTDLPADVSMLERAIPIYEELPGWQCDTTGVRSVEELPPQAQSYVRFLSREAGAPITILGIGPARDEVMTVPTAWLDAAPI